MDRYRTLVTFMCNGQFSWCFVLEWWEIKYKFIERQLFQLPSSKVFFFFFGGVHLNWSGYNVTLVLGVPFICFFFFFFELVHQGRKLKNFPPYLRNTIGNRYWHLEGLKSIPQVSFWFLQVKSKVSNWSKNSQTALYLMPHSKLCKDIKGPWAIWKKPPPWKPTKTQEKIGGRSNTEHSLKKNQTNLWSDNFKKEGKMLKQKIME